MILIPKESLTEKKEGNNTHPNQIHMIVFSFNPFKTNGIFRKFDTVKSGWSVVYIEGSKAIISKKIIFLSVKINSVLTNSADPDEMQHCVAFHLGLHCLPMYPFWGFPSPKG